MHHTTKRRLTLALFASLTLLACESGLILDAPAPPFDDSLLHDDDPYEAPIAYDYVHESVEKFQVADTLWTQRDLTWCMASYTPDLTPQQQTDAITRAWDTWQRSSGLTFRRLTSCANAHFTVSFAAGDHGDGNPFDAEGGVLAHAFFPRNGRIHFDEAETWTTDTRPHAGGAKDLQTVALHEIGHALGLHHSDVEGAVMFAFYGGSLRELQADDTLGIQSVYPPANNPPADDHGNTLASATLTALGRTLDGSINTPGDVDVLAFDANANTPVVLASAGSTDTVCTLLDRDNTRLAENDDTPAGRNCRIEATLPRAGRYYVAIRHYDPSRTGPYAFSLTTPNAPPDPQPEEPRDPACPAGTPCNPIAVNAFPFSHTADTRTATSDAFDRYSCAPSTNESGPEVLYTVLLNQPGQLTASVNDVRGDSIDIDVHLLRAPDPDACIARDNARTTAQLNPGRYYVSVDTWVNASGTPFPGPYTLTLTFTPNPGALDADHSDSFDDPTPIPEDTHLLAAIDTPGDNDLFLITPADDAPFALLTEGPTPTSCQLYDAQRALLQAHTPCQLQHHLLAGRAYTLRVTHAQPDGTGPYTLITFPDTAEQDAPDQDEDGVPDHLDLCPQTPRGARVWNTPEWRGCAPGQTRG